jgi:hypothetical protein
MPERPLHAGASKLEMNAVTAGNTWQVGAVKLWAPSYIASRSRRSRVVKNSLGPDYPAQMLVEARRVATAGLLPFQSRQSRRGVDPGGFASALFLAVARTRSP